MKEERFISSDFRSIRVDFSLILKSGRNIGTMVYLVWYVVIWVATCIFRFVLLSSA